MSNRIVTSSGVVEIAKERFEQIDKHRWDIQHDLVYKNEQLIDAAIFAINPEQFPMLWPDGWGTYYRDKIIGKNQIQRLTVAGAFIAAEIDRLLYEQETTARSSKEDAGE